MRFISKFFKSKSSVINVVRLNGVIASGSKFPGSSNLSLESLEKQIERAFSGKKIAGVALIINSPGGSPVQSALISERIIELSKKNNIPVFAFVEDVAASGGYWLACAADEIFVMPASIVGSIGVISAGFGFVEVIKKIGVERRVFSKGENKGMLDPFQPQNSDDVKVITDLQEEIHQLFKNWVSKRRGNRLNAEVVKAEGIFEAKIFSGTKACEIGLADSMGELKQVMRERFNEKVIFKEISGRKKLGQRLGLSSSSYYGVIDYIEERIAFAKFGL
ncbi:MAG: S49 family peptidase [Alphaproteobacteria bacterium]|jgi:signal peptide peptidase SppA|nr:S49 family peptidase [Alphaproteobacteria bacterium]